MQFLLEARKECLRPILQKEYNKDLKLINKVILNSEQCNSLENIIQENVFTNWQVRESKVILQTWLRNTEDENKFCAIF